MDRRDFLRSVGGSLCGLGATAGLVGIGGSFISFSDSIEVNVYQEKELTEYIDETWAYPKDTFARSLETSLPQVFEQNFSNVDVNISVEQLDITIEDQEAITGAGSTQKGALEWAEKVESSDKIKPAKHSNLLIRSFPSDDPTYEFAGYGVGGVLPSCCKIHNGYSTVWIRPWSIDHSGFLDTAIHEIGHSLGLTHFHGCNVSHPEEGHSIMLPPYHAEKFDENLFGQQITEAENNFVLRFNSKLESRHLRI